jgi:hypothetical protein
MITNRKRHNNKSSLNINTTPTNKTGGGNRLSQVFSINKRLSTQIIPQQQEQIKQSNPSRKPSFFSLKPSVSTPSNNTAMLRRKKDENKSNNGIVSPLLKEYLQKH